MERNGPEPPALPQRRPRERERLLELVELVVDGDAQRLEGALGRVATGEARGRGHRPLDHVHELLGRLQLALVAATHDRARDRVGVALLAVLAQQAREATLIPRVHDLGRGHVLVGVHPHVQRSVVGVGEPAVAGVHLQRGHAEVEQHEIGPDGLGDEGVESLDERHAQEARVAGHLRGELREMVLRRRVAVDADQRPAGPQPLGNQPRVTRAADRAVDRGLTRTRVERLDQLARKNRDVDGGHVKKDGQSVQ